MTLKTLNGVAEGVINGVNNKEMNGYMRILRTICQCQVFHQHRITICLLFQHVLVLIFYPTVTFLL